MAFLRLFSASSVGRENSGASARQQGVRRAMQADSPRARGLPAAPVYETLCCSPLVESTMLQPQRAEQESPPRQWREGESGETESALAGGTGFPDGLRGGTFVPWTFFHGPATVNTGRGTQVVRERSAKPLCVGSIPTRASSLFMLLAISPDVAKNHRTSMIADVIDRPSQSALQSHFDSENSGRFDQRWIIPRDRSRGSVA